MRGAGGVSLAFTNYPGYGWYFTFIQGWVYVALIFLQGFTWEQTVNPLKTYVKLSAVLMFSNGFTKVLPVMVMGAFIPGLRRKYRPREYLSAILLVVGLIVFTLADAQTSPNFSLIGVIMVSGALVMDAFLGNLQEAIFTMNPETTPMEMLLCSTLVGMPFLFLPMTIEFGKAFNSCYQHPYVYGVLVFEALATFVGQVSVLSLIGSSPFLVLPQPQWSVYVISLIGDNGEESGNITLVILDIYNAINWTTWKWTSANINGDCNEAFA
ncbi:hypothetical protein RHSIM_Rhsim01G0154900 [Rhododendron simsii]|uniref:Uncharacterized protein n=1 Tax=Rhododendron simsii TaxID=118357 RepID=A0A834HNJ0_RHOSS|nr:hypothetical protein RHSIM_Rhsim01G0154900 [Rhododendron simsii]